MRRVFQAALIGFLLAGCASGPGPSKIVSIYVLTPAQRTAVEAGTRAALKDPDSARFGVIKAAIDDGDGIFVCGMVNARNSFGGMVGEQPFFGLLAEKTTGGQDWAFAALKFGATASDAMVVRMMCGARRIDPTVP